MQSEYIYGIQPVLQVLKAKRRKVLELFVHPGRASEIQQILKLAKTQGVKIHEVDRMKLHQLTETPHHQGVVLKVEAYPYFAFETLLQNLKQKERGSVVLILDQIQDPQNLGAILRTAYCAGVEAVLLPERGSALVNATVLKTSAGAAEHLSVCLVKNLARAIDELKEIPFWIYGSEAGDHPPYFKQDFKGNTAIVMGSEGSGLRELIRKKCDFLVSIPTFGLVSALNVSVATGIMLFETVRQKLKS